MCLVAASLHESFAGWRRVARELLRRRVSPERVLWRGADDGQPVFDGLAGDAPAVAADDDRPLERVRVPREFVALGERAACHRDPGRWALLYRVLWRLAHGEPRLLDVVVDDDVHRLLAMDKAVRRDAHKMKAFVRFRRVDAPHRAGGGGEDGADETSARAAEHYVAWHRPDHL